jgi:hypothetical protein
MDDVAPQAERFVLASAEVAALVGTPASAQITDSIFYEGIPEREAPYREYKMTVSGSNGRALVIVRAEKIGAEWTYRLQSVQRR